MLPARTAVTLLCGCSLCSLLVVSAVPFSLEATDPFPLQSVNAHSLRGIVEDGLAFNVSQAQHDVDVATKKRSAERNSFDEGALLYAKGGSVTERAIDEGGAGQGEAQGSRMIWEKVIAMLAIALASTAGAMPPIIGWSSGLPQGTEPRHFFWLRSFCAGKCWHEFSWVSIV